MLCTCLQPAVREGARTLILGSMPGIASLSAREYYAYPMNRFWRMMATLLGEPFPTDYPDRIAMVQRHGIAIWDAIARCEREGSLDSAIKNEEGADISALLEAYPTIKTICCNGKKAYAAFKKYNRPLLAREDLAIHAMPSTSAANARYTMEKLLAAWQVAITPAHGRGALLRCQPASGLFCTH